MNWNKHLPLLATLPFALTATNCYLTFDEGLQEVDVHGKVIIEASVAGVSDFNDLSPEELRRFINELGVVYIGAWSGFEARQGVIQPTFDPFSQNAFPYGGSTVGAYAYVGLDYLLDCSMITGRFFDIENILTYWDLRINPSGAIISRQLDYKAYIADGVVVEDEALELQKTSTYPRMTEEEYVASLLADEYFRFYLPPPTEGCKYDENGDLVLDTCTVSDFDFYGNIPWKINGEGNLEAPFVMYKVFTPTNESGEIVYPKLWAWADQDSSTCNEADGQYTSVPYIDTLNFPCRYMTEGDLVSQPDGASAQSIPVDGLGAEVRIRATVPALSDDEKANADGEPYVFPYCGY